MKVLFVCSGNICRSPIAEAILKARLREEGLRGVDAASAGTLHLEGLPADPRAASVAAASGYDLSAHRSRGLTRELLLDSDLVAALDREHLEETARLAPAHPGIHLLTSFLPEGDPGREPGGVPDPIGGDDEEFRECLTLIERCVDGMRPALGSVAAGEARQEPPGSAAGEIEEEYFRRVEAIVAEARGGSARLSPLEFHLVDRWWESGVPLWIVIESIRRTAALWPPGEAPRSFLKHVEKEVATSLEELGAGPEERGSRE